MYAIAPGLGRGPILKGLPIAIYLTWQRLLLGSLQVHPLLPPLCRGHEVVRKEPEVVNVLNQTALKHDLIARRSCKDPFGIEGHSLAFRAFAAAHALSGSHSGNGEGPVALFIGAISNAKALMAEALLFLRMAIVS